MNTTTFKGPTTFYLKSVVAQNTLFLDRDGVLNHVVIRENEVSSPRSFEEFQLADDIDALSDPHIQGKWNLVMVTNQPDVSRGWVSLELLEKFHSAIADRIALNAIYLCPHLGVDRCSCRKPAHGMIRRFRQDHPYLKGKEFFVGDRISDQQCASEASIPFVLRRRPYNRELEKTSSYAISDLCEIHTLLKKEKL